MSACAVSLSTFAVFAKPPAAQQHAECAQVQVWQRLRFTALSQERCERKLSESSRPSEGLVTIVLMLGALTFIGQLVPVDAIQL